MKAKEARAESIKNQLDKDEALKQIKNSVDLGYTYCVFSGKSLSDSAALELMQDGYKISKHTDLISGGDMYKVDW